MQNERIYIFEDITKSDVRSIINSRVEEFLKEREFEKRVKEITSDVLEKFFRSMYTKRNFWKGEIR